MFRGWLTPLVTLILPSQLSPTLAVTPRKIGTPRKISLRNPKPCKCRPTLPRAVPEPRPSTHTRTPGPAPLAAPPSAPCPAPVRSRGSGSAGLSSAPQLEPCKQQRRAAPSPHLGDAPGRNAPAVPAAPGLAWGGPAECRTPPPRPTRSSTAALARTGDGESDVRRRRAGAEAVFAAAATGRR